MIIFTAIVVALAALVFSLLVRRVDLPETAPAAPFDPLQEKKEAIYENLRDLHFEFRVGKLTEDDYQQAKAELQKELAAVTQAAAGATAAPAKVQAAPATPPGLVCPHCGARFEQTMKFCGECGGAMSGGAA